PRPLTRHRRVGKIRIEESREFRAELLDVGVKGQLHITP
ncbi:MAG: hypothetical protein QOH91_2711, partial [Mycobacterium sp.]|nr:hypothetical protein [Mycobacterium sp.]